MSKNWFSWYVRNHIDVRPSKRAGFTPFTQQLCLFNFIELSQN